MKTLFLVAILFANVFLYTSCKKNEKGSAKNNLADSDEVVLLNDENFLRSFAENVFSNNDTDAQKNQRKVVTDICGATIDKSLFITNKEIKLNFDGKIRCSDGYSRAGVVVLTLTKCKSWSDKGAEISMVYINYTITRPVHGNENNTLTFTGTKIITNSLGGLVSEISAAKPIIHIVKSQDFLIKHNDEDYTTSTWNSHRKKTISVDTDGAVGVRHEGLEKIGDKTSIADWGKDRNGDDFKSYFSEPKIQKFCNSNLKDISGIKVKEGKLIITYTFGVDANGSQAPACSAYGFKISWNDKNGNKVEKVIKY